MTPSSSCTNPGRSVISGLRRWTKRSESSRSRARCRGRSITGGAASATLSRTCPRHSTLRASGISTAKRARSHTFPSPARISRRRPSWPPSPSSSSCSAASRRWAGSCLIYVLKICGSYTPTGRFRRRDMPPGRPPAICPGQSRPSGRDIARSRTARSRTWERMARGSASAARTTGSRTMTFTTWGRGACALASRATRRPHPRPPNAIPSTTT